MPLELDQQLVVGVVAAGAQELHPEPRAALLHQQHLVDELAGQPVRGSPAPRPARPAPRGRGAGPARPADTGAAIAVIAVDVLVLQVPATLRGRRPSRSSCCSMPCAWAWRWPGPAHTPPLASASSSAISARPGRLPCPARPASSPDRWAGSHRRSPSGRGLYWRQTVQVRGHRALLPGQHRYEEQIAANQAAGLRHQVRLSRTRRTQQNLPFVIIPSRRTSRPGKGLTGLDQHLSCAAGPLRQPRWVTLAMLGAAVLTIAAAIETARGPAAAGDIPGLATRSPTSSPQ